MTKIVINRCFGGFGLSKEAIELYGKKKGLDLITVETGYAFGPDFYIKEVSNENYFSDRDIARDDPDLIEVVEELGSLANGFAAELKIVEIPDDVEWQIEDYDGNEHIAEKHRTWS